MVAGQRTYPWMTTPPCLLFANSLTAEGGTRTHTPLRGPDFETGASANSATSALSTTRAIKIVLRRILLFPGYSAGQSGATVSVVLRRSSSRASFSPWPSSSSATSAGSTALQSLGHSGQVVDVASGRGRGLA